MLGQPINEDFMLSDEKVKIDQLCYSKLPELGSPNFQMSDIIIEVKKRGKNRDKINLPAIALTNFQSRDSRK